MKKLLLPLIASFAFASTLDNIMLEMNNHNYTKAISLLKQQKETKKIDFLLGSAYYKRHLIYTDYMFAIKYLKKAKTPKAYYYLAQMYEKGLGVDKNIDTAIKYYQLSNTKEAKYRLAQLHMQGKYLLKTPTQVVKLLKSSAKEGYNKAQLELGKLYLSNNDYVDKNLKKASKWIYLAFKNGNKEAINIWNKYKLYKYQ